MSTLERLGLNVLRQLDPETAHGLSIKALKTGLAPLPDPVVHPCLKCQIAGLHFANPVGLAAGYDKNAEVIAPLLNAGFGFIEVGAATPRAQPGNPKPRLFRLTQDQAAINRFGFNNDGMQAIAARLANRPKSGILGLNLGANKDSANRADDFAQVLMHCGAHLDFATVNVSSPNTEKLRDLQGAAALNALLEGVMQANRSLHKPIPIFLKIAPDLTDIEISEIADVARATGLDAIITTNTTLDRHGLTSPDKGEKGGLSGAPLFEKSTQVLAKLASQTDIPLIGVGGISSAEQAYAKIKAGATAVQIYTGMVYHGLSLVQKINQGLISKLKTDGYTSISQAIGRDKTDWL
ncbi:quinone-dependent dihydroorotate dehydrogenase [Algirhabdus cladophorae]|uniref:quinone-dependent dihydroorotate dehydrogenase n=1 Tax=Algirhabdus cladophorae TaxID=3377108 RepID=UPI003B845BC5